MPDESPTNNHVPDVPGGTQPISESGQPAPSKEAPPAATGGGDDFKTPTEKNIVAPSTTVKAENTKKLVEAECSDADTVESATGECSQQTPPPPSGDAKSLSRLVAPEQIRQFLEMMFGRHKFAPTTLMCVRRIGEVGTDAKGRVEKEAFRRLDSGDLADTIARSARVCADKRLAMYIIPGVLKAPNPGEAPSGKASDLEAFTTLLADIDSGDTIKKLAFAEEHLGPATMVVHSGGVTAEGKPKLHVYWALSKPAYDIPRVIKTRDRLARNIGADPQFGLGTPSNPSGRAHQPIRIPGTCHGKNGLRKTCSIVQYSPGVIYELEQLEQALAAMPAGPWTQPEQNSGGEPPPSLAKRSVAEALVTPVHEGSVDNNTRFGAFSQVAGFFIFCARNGVMTLNAAKQALHGWVKVEMKPPWTHEAVDKQWDRLLRVDVSKNGPIPVPPQSSPQWQLIDAAEFIKSNIEPLTELVTGLLHQGSKLVIGGGSKSFKTWVLIHLALCVAFGLVWLGFKTKQGKVLYVNFEIQPFCFQQRLKVIAQALGVNYQPGAISILNLRGCAGDYRTVLKEIERATQGQGFALIILDPIYKLYGETDENSAGDVAKLLNRIEEVTVNTGAAIAFAAHYAKGNSAKKESIDRISGSGVFARDPDSLLTFTAHKEDNAFTVEATLRNFPPIAPVAVRWEYPLMHIDKNLDPAALKRPSGGRKRKHKSEDLLDLLPEDGLTTMDWLNTAKKKMGVSNRTFYRLRSELESQGQVKTLGSGEDAKWITNDDLSCTKK